MKIQKSSTVDFFGYVLLPVSFPHKTLIVLNLNLVNLRFKISEKTLFRLYIHLPTLAGWVKTEKPFVAVESLQNDRVKKTGCTLRVAKFDLWAPIFLQCRNFLLPFMHVTFFACFSMPLTLILSFFPFPSTAWIFSPPSLPTPRNDNFTPDAKIFN